MIYSARGYFAVKLTALQESGLRSSYWSMYEGIADALARLDGFTLHAPHRLTDPHSADPDGLSPRDIYLLDRLHVTHADVVVACIELPSFGVGAELQLANDQGIPIIPFYYVQARHDPSRLVLGMPGVGATSGDGKSRLLRYTPSIEGQTELQGQIVETVRQLLTEFQPRTVRPRRRIAASLESRRQNARVTITELARQACLTAETVELLTLAGSQFRDWLAGPKVRQRVSIDIDAVDEDLVLLPSVDAVLRLITALRVPMEEIPSLLGLTSRVEDSSEKK